MLRSSFLNWDALTLPNWPHLEGHRLRQRARAHRSAQDRRRVMDGKVNVDALITHVMPLKDISRAFDLKHSGEPNRSVVTF